jgi:hypothetical protein
MLLRANFVAFCEGSGLERDRSGLLSILSHFEALWISLIQTPTLVRTPIELKYLLCWPLTLSLLLDIFHGAECYIWELCIWSHYHEIPSFVLKSEYSLQRLIRTTEPYVKPVSFGPGRAIAQAVSRWLPTAAAARVKPGASHVGFCDGQK